MIYYNCMKVLNVYTCSGAPLAWPTAAWARLVACAVDPSLRQWKHAHAFLDAHVEDWLRREVGCSEQMIRWFLLQNRAGRTRLAKYYVPMDDAQKRKNEYEVFRTLSGRESKWSNVAEVRTPDHL